VNGTPVRPGTGSRCGAPLCVLGLLLAGCGSEEVSRVVALEPEPPLHEAVEVFRLGSVDGLDDAFAPIGRGLLNIDPSTQRIVVGQPGRGEVRVYDAEGQLVTIMGGRGEGPGEFNAMLSLGILGDTIYVTNLSPPRITYFSISGDHLDTGLLSLDSEIGTGLFPAPPSTLFPDGRGGIATPLLAGSDFVLDIDVPTLWVDRDGSVLDTLFTLSTLESSVHLEVDTPLGARTSRVSRPFPDFPLFAVSPAGARLAVVERRRHQDPSQDTHYRVSVRTLTGDTLYTESYRYATEPLTREQMAEVVDAFIDRASDRVPWIEGSALQEVIQVPNSPPFVSRAVIADDGSLWLQQVNAGTEESETWFVHDPDGTPVARVSLPANFDLHMVHGSTAWGVERDEYETPYVVAFALGG